MHDHLLRFTMRQSCTRAIGVLLLSTALAAAQESESLQYWPKWRGPLGTGEAPQADPPLTWDGASGKNVRWKVKLPGSGTGTPIIWEDDLFVLTAEANGAEAAAENAESEDQPARRGRGPRTVQPSGPVRFMILCLDRRTGATRWQQVAREQLPHEGHHPDHGFASSSVVTDGRLVFAYFGSRGLYCYDRSGKLQWEKDLGRMQTRNGFGEGSSPALHGDTLVVNWDHEGDDFVAAFDKNTGDELWRQPRDEPTTWSTPLIVEHDGRAQAVIAATSKVRSYDLQTGEVVWESPGLTVNAIPTPVANDEMVYVTSGFRGSALYAIRLGHTGDLTGSDAIAWSLNRSTPYVPSPLLYEDRLYFFASNNGILSAHDAQSGRPVIETQRIDALQGVYASPIAASGRIYLVGRNGVTVVIAQKDELETLATNELGEPVDASPAAVGNALYLRGHEHLYCVEE